jgi:hypothetical protein
MPKNDKATKTETAAADRWDSIALAVESSERHTNVHLVASKNTAGPDMTAAVQQAIGDRLAEAGKQFLETDVQALELARLSAASGQLADKAKAAQAEAEASAKRVKDAVVQAGDVDEAITAEAVSKRRAASYAELVEQTESRIEELRPLVKRRQLQAVQAELEAARREVKVEYDRIVSESLAVLLKNPATIGFVLMEAPEATGLLSRAIASDE